MGSEVDEDDLSLTNYLLKFNGDEEEPWESGEELSIGGESFGDLDQETFELDWALRSEDLDTQTFEAVQPSFENQELSGDVILGKGKSTAAGKSGKGGTKQPTKTNGVSDSARKKESKASESDNSDVCEVISPKVASKPPVAGKRKVEIKSSGLDNTDMHELHVKLTKVASKPTVAVKNVCNSAKVEQTPAKSQAEKAKLQRAKKKKYVEELQDTIAQLNRDKAGLQQVTVQLSEKIESLRDEIRYLKGVITNQSELAAILRSVASTPGISISCSSLQDSECNVDKRKCDANGKVALDVDKGNKKRKIEETSGEMDGKAGVCVHVQSGKVSVEFCPDCSRKANGILP